MVQYILYGVYGSYGARYECLCDINAPYTQRDTPILTAPHYLFAHTTHHHTGTLVNTAEKNDKLISFAMATGHAERDVLSAELQSVLEALTQDSRNNIFVVSGKEQPAVVQVSVA